MFQHVFTVLIIITNLHATLIGSDSDIKIENSVEYDPPCLISSHSTDGAGHQLEAKLSCMAAADHLNSLYIHIPMNQTEHGADATLIEQLLNLGYGQTIFDSSLMSIVERPINFVGSCGGSWADNFQKACSKDGKTVYSADNCYNYFWCNLSNDTFMESWLYKTLPKIRSSLEQSDLLKYIPLEENNPNIIDEINIVVHIRIGDSSGRGVEPTWFIKVLELLQKKHINYTIYQMGHGIQPTIAKYWIHTDDELEIAKLFQKHHVSSKYFKLAGIFTKSNLDLALQQMLAADIFVGSISALTHTVAMIGDMPKIYPSGSSSRMNAHYLNWHVLPTEESFNQQDTMEMYSGTDSNINDVKVTSTADDLNLDALEWPVKTRNHPIFHKEYNNTFDYLNYNTTTT